MNKFFVIFVTLGIIFAKASILTEYENHQYNKLCQINNISSISDEKLLSIIGISCVKSDNLYLLPYIVAKLKNSKMARENSLYFLTIYMQKRLLYSYFFDNLSLNGFNFPKTDYILSKIFYKIKHNEFKKKGNMLIIKLKNELIKVYPNNGKLYVCEYENKKLIKRHWFK